MNEAPASIKLEMCENTMYAKNFRSIGACIAVTFIACWTVSATVNWHEINMKTELAKIETSPEGIQHALLARDRAMFESTKK